MENLVRVIDPNALDDLVERSRHQPVVIFKHSITCPLSALAYRQMSKFDGEVTLVEVQRARELAREIENRTGITHQSPQVLVLRNGQVVWNASHLQITAGAVARAVSQAVAGTSK